MENKTLLEIKNITVLFNQGTPYEKTVLDDFNLNCYEGDFIVLLGSNGAGKSTLFNAILGNLDYSGDIVLNDKNINKMKTFKRCKQIERYIKHILFRPNYLPICVAMCAILSFRSNL